MGVPALPTRAAGDGEFMATCGAESRIRAEVGIDPGKIEIDPSILDRFEIDSIQIMGLERQIDLTLKWS